MVVARDTFITVSTEDLPRGSKEKVTRRCDRCGRLDSDRIYVNILRVRRSDGKDYCHSCTLEELDMIKKANLPFEKSISFTHPEVAKLFRNKGEANNLTYGAGKRTDFICEFCGYIIRDKVVSSIVKRGLSCPRCSDSLSYPEKFMSSLLYQLQVKPKYNMKLNWSENRRYDFYIDSLSCIIETHGIQHYEAGFEAMGGRSLEEEQENDRHKKQLAEENGIENYIEIDCRFSDLKFIKNNILNSNLNNLFNLEGIDWIECHRYAGSSLIQEVAKIWNNGVKNIDEIGLIANIARGTALKYIKQATELGLCDYSVETAIAKRRINASRGKRKRLVQLTLDGHFIEEWEHTKDAADSLNILKSTITNACNKKTASAGGYRWMYKEDYETNKDLIELGVLPVSGGAAILQLDFSGNIINEYKSITDACRKTGFTSISAACRGINRHAGGFLWVYKEKYEDFVENELPFKFTKKERKPYSKKKGGEVLQLTLNNEVVCSWASVKEASKSTGVNANNIYACCLGTRGSTSGFKWTYKEDYKKII